MGTALHELPLALFSTLAPIGAGAFVMLFAAFCKGRFSDSQLKAIDRFTAIPILVALAGLCCSFAHLTNPGNAMNVMSTIGSTPLANEITAFGAFMALAVVYWLVGLAGGLKARGARLLCSGIVAVSALVAMAFIGLAYALPTIPVWDTPWTVVMMVGIGLFGGMICGAVVLAHADAGRGLDGGADAAVFGLFCLGLVLALAGTIAIWAMGAGSQSVLVDVAANAGSLVPPFVIFIILALVACVLGFAVLMVDASRALSWAGLAVVAVACLLARLVFYGMQIGVGF